MSADAPIPQPEQHELELYDAWRTRRDRGALERLLALKLPFVYRVACHITSNSHDAEDVTQQVLLALCSARPRTIRALDPWLYVATVRAARDLSRAERRRKARENMEHGMAARGEESDPLQQAGGREEHAALHAALGELPAPLREVVVLEYMEHLPRKIMCEALELSESAVRERLTHALEQLQRLLTRRGVVLGAGALIAALGALPAPAAPAVLAAQLSSTAAATSVGATKVGIAAAFLLTVPAVFFAWRAFQPIVPAGAPATKPPTLGAQPAKPLPDEQPVTRAALWITPRGPVARQAFEQLRAQGLNVASLFDDRTLKVPTALRYKRVDGHELLSAVAATRGAKVEYVRGGQAAVLYRPISDETFSAFKAEIESANQLTRWDAAWRGGWLRDVRVVPLLVKAARDADAEVAHQSRKSLQRLGWEAVLALDESAYDFAAAAAMTFDDAPRWAGESTQPWRSAMTAIGHYGGEKALPILEAALSGRNADGRARAYRDEDACNHAATVLGAIGGERALALLEPLLTEPDDERLQYHAYYAMGFIGTERALKNIEAGIELKGENNPARNGAAEALMRIKGPAAVALLKKAVSNADPNVRLSAGLGLAYNDENGFIEHMERALADEAAGGRGPHALLLGYAAGERGLDAVEIMLASPDAAVRRDATSALGCTGSARDLALLDRALADAHQSVRAAAASSLNKLDFDAAWPRVQKALTDQDDSVGASAFGALQEFDDPRAKALAKTALASLPASVRASANSFRLGVMTQDAAHARTLLEEALKSNDRDRLAALATDLRFATGGLALEFLGRLFDGSDQRARYGAAESLGEIGGRQSLELLEKRLRGDESPQVRSSAVSAVGKIGGPKALALLDELLGDPDGNVSKAAGKALVACAGEKALPRLEAAIDAPNAQKRFSAAEALGFLGGEKASALLAKAIADNDMKVRGNATDALARIGGERELALLEGMLRDEQELLRYNLAHALGHLGPKLENWQSDYDPTPGAQKKSLELLEKLLADKTASVRKQAASSLGLVGGERAKELLLGALKIEKTASVQLRIIAALRAYKGDALVDRAVRDKPVLPADPVKPPAQSKQKESAEEAF